MKQLLEVYSITSSGAHKEQPRQGPPRRGLLNRALTWEAREYVADASMEIEPAIATSNPQRGRSRIIAGYGALRF